MRWRQLRDDAVAQLQEARVDDPAQEVRWIIEQASGLTPAAQAAALDEPVDDRHLLGMERMVSRRAAGEPLQHVLGHWGFRTLDLLVDRRVLIPRPETELVAGLAIAELAALGRPGLGVDLGTGSGAIALSLAAEMWPHVEVWGTDASADALAVARANLAALGRRGAAVRLVEGDWFAALPDELCGGVDVVVSNPPYVAEQDPLPDDVARWEPRMALVPGPTGLEAIERIVTESPRWLARSGSLVLEIGETQGDAVAALARSRGFSHVAVHPDLSGRDRALVARR